MPIAVPVLLSLAPSAHLVTRATTLRLIGELSCWINKHPTNLELVLSFILASLQACHYVTILYSVLLCDCTQMRPVASEAANTVKSVCNYCRHHMGPHFTGLIQVLLPWLPHYLSPWQP